jgi:hypothetical protein
MVAVKPYLHNVNWTQGIDPKTGKPIAYDRRRWIHGAGDDAFGERPAIRRESPLERAPCRERSSSTRRSCDPWVGIKSRGGLGPGWYIPALVNARPSVKQRAGIEHVGSRAVPNLAAKPIIDMDLIVDDPTRAARARIDARMAKAAKDRRACGV